VCNNKVWLRSKNICFLINSTLYMQNWLNFWIFIFWISLLSFLINSNNFINLLIYSEIVWINLYCYSILTGSINDDLNLLTLSFFILALASMEFVLGYLLIILFKNFNKNLNFNEVDKIWYNYLYLNKNNLNLTKINWNETNSQ
jgi:NADH:ubiquinone oxidoreductase subunit K